MTEGAGSKVPNVNHSSSNTELSSSSSSSSTHGSSITLNIITHEEDVNETCSTRTENTATVSHQDNVDNDLESLEPYKKRATTTLLRILERILTIQNIILAIPTSILAIIGYRYLKWTAWKDFREDCRETLALTNQPLSDACVKALSGPYMSAPGRTRGIPWFDTDYRAIKHEPCTSNKNCSTSTSDGMRVDRARDRIIQRQADAEIQYSYSYDANAFLKHIQQLERLDFLDELSVKDELELQTDPPTTLHYKYDYTTTTGLCSIIHKPIPGPLVYHTPNNPNCFYQIIPRTFESFNTATCPACEVGNVIRCQQWWRARRAENQRQSQSRVTHWKIDINSAVPSLVDSMNVVLVVVLLLWVGPMTVKWFRHGSDGEGSVIRLRDIVLTCLTVQVLAHAAIMAGTGEQLI